MLIGLRAVTLLWGNVSNVNTNSAVHAKIGKKMSSWKLHKVSLPNSCGKKIIQHAFRDYCH